MKHVCSYYVENNLGGNMSRLTKMLEYAYAGNSQRSRIANTESFKKIVLDTIPKERKELLLNEGLESDTLLQEEVYNTIIEGSKPIQCVRNVFPIIKTDTYQIRITKENGNLGKAVDVAEGAAIPIDTESFTTTDLKIKKIGTRPIITNELIEDGLWDMVEFELKRAGQKLEHKFNYDVINEAVDKSTYSAISTVDAGADFTPANVLEAIKNVLDNDYVPTHMIMTPFAENKLIGSNNLLQANYAGSDSALRNYDLGKLFGLTLSRLTVDGDPSKTYKWNSGNDTQHDVHALVFDPTYCMIGMRRDITVEQYDDPIHDLVGLSATMRYGVKTIQPEKASIIEH